MPSQMRDLSFYIYRFRDDNSGEYTYGFTAHFNREKQTHVSEDSAQLQLVLNDIGSILEARSDDSFVISLNPENENDSTDPQSYLNPKLELSSEEKLEVEKFIELHKR